MKTAPIKLLIHEVLNEMQRPYTEHVIDDVFFAIESRPDWRSRYDDICTSLGKTVVNTWGGYWIANALEKRGEHQATSKKSSLISSYSLLDTDATLLAVKPKEPEALKLMSDYYQAHKSELPVDIKKYREQIVELIMEGISPHDAFSMALSIDT